MNASYNLICGRGEVTLIFRANFMPQNDGREESVHCLQETDSPWHSQANNIHQKLPESIQMDYGCICIGNDVKLQCFYTSSAVRPSKYNVANMLWHIYIYIYRPMFVYRQQLTVVFDTRLVFNSFHQRSTNIPDHYIRKCMYNVKGFEKCSVRNEIVDIWYVGLWSNLVFSIDTPYSKLWYSILRNNCRWCKT